MIRNNLAILMTEKGMKSSLVAAKTNLPQETIQSIASNKEENTRLSTVNKLCQILDVTPSEYFSYLPFDISIKVYVSGIELIPRRKVVQEEMSGNGDTPIINSLTLEAFFIKEATGRSDAYGLSGRLVTPVDVLLEEPLKFSLAFDEEEGVSFWNEIPDPFKEDLAGKLRDSTVREVGRFLDKYTQAIFNEEIDYDGYFEYGDYKDPLLKKISTSIDLDGGTK